MQKLILFGRATKDAVVVESKSGNDFVSFSIAVNRYRGKDTETETTYYDCILFGENRIQPAAEKIKKGDLVVVEGRPQAEGYTDKEGNSKANLKVVVEEWQVLK